MRGQVGVEAAACAMVLLMMFVVVAWQAQRWTELARFEQTSGQQKAECIQLQSAVYLVRSVNENAQIELQISNDVNFAKNSINFSSYYCNFSGNWIDATLSKGNVRIEKVNGVVSVHNF